VLSLGSQTQRKHVVTDPRVLRLAGWTDLSTPKAWISSGRIRELTVDVGPDSFWFASVVGKGLWKSSDAGKSWESCTGLPAEVLAVRGVTDRPERLVAATEEGCWMSNDFGQTWESRSAGLESAPYVSAIAVHPTQPDRLLAGAAPQAPSKAPSDDLNFALYETTDGGTSWSPVVKRGNPEHLERDVITDIRHDPVAPDNILVALSSGELWGTRNGGFYWVPLARQIRAARVLCPVG
jgi:photosystem II stability/assembly factor-like uncharacterized protein